MLRLLEGEWLDAAGEEQLVLKRVEYYFHSKVASFEFGVPNAYASREEWQRQSDELGVELSGENLFRKYIRRMAWRDEAETEINTHPVGYIGADNKGLDQVLSPPGGTNRDSHGTYPGVGLWKDIGPAGATETIPFRFVGIDAGVTVQKLPNYYLEPFYNEAQLDWWEYSGSLRYSLLTGSVQPFAKGGYGLSWYRLEDVSTEGRPIDTPDSEWVRKPSIIPPNNLLPNTWHIGAGLELIAVQGYGSLPKGIDFSLTAEWLYYTNKLGLDTTGVPIELLIQLGVSADSCPGLARPTTSPARPPERRLACRPG